MNLIIFLTIVWLVTTTGAINITVASMNFLGWWQDDAHGNYNKLISDTDKLSAAKSLEVMPMLKSMVIGLFLCQ